MSTWQEQLVALQNDIWEHKPATGNSYAMSYEKRRLTADEWEMVQNIVTLRRPICEMINACMGFGCGMRLYEPSQFPGVPPTFLAVVTKEHLPIPVREAGSTRLADRTTFEDGWEAFSPYTHNAANASLLAFHALPAPKSKGYYDY